MENIVKARIAELEKQLEKAEKKVIPGSSNVIEMAIKVEKIKYAINQLYICLGEHR